MEQWNGWACHEVNIKECWQMPTAFNWNDLSVFCLRSSIYRVNDDYPVDSVWLFSYFRWIHQHFWLNLFELVLIDRYPIAADVAVVLVDVQMKFTAFWRVNLTNSNHILTKTSHISRHQRDVIERNRNSLFLKPTFANVIVVRTNRNGYD